MTFTQHIEYYIRVETEGGAVFWSSVKELIFRCMQYNTAQTSYQAGSYALFWNSAPSAAELT